MIRIWIRNVMLFEVQTNKRFEFLRCTTDVYYVYHKVYYSRLSRRVLCRPRCSSVFCTFLDSVGRQVPEMCRERLKFVYTEGKRTRKRISFFNICRCLQPLFTKPRMDVLRQPERCSEAVHTCGSIQSLWSFFHSTGTVPGEGGKPAAVDSVVNINIKLGSL